MPSGPRDRPLPDEFVELIARRFAALGDPMRVRLLDALRCRGEASVGELADALDAHREALDLPAARTHARRLGALADFVAEHGERGLRALGGRRDAQRWLAGQDAALEQPALLRALEARAGL